MLPLVLELALACLEGAALGRAVMILQEAADDSEAQAAAALVTASHSRADVMATSEAIQAAASLARVERAELAAATKWAAHVADSRELARRALAVVAAGGGEPAPPVRRRTPSQ
jgi:hypothetical protein